MRGSVCDSLLCWCIEELKNYPSINVENFSSSWKDGLAFCALIHKYFPDLVDIDALSPEEAVKNLELAFFVAETKLDVPVLISPHDVVSERRLDENLILDYVSRLHRAISRKFSDQMLLTASPETDLSCLCEKEVVIPSCSLCGQSIFRLELLTVFSKNYHRSCYRDNQLNYLKERNRTIKTVTVTKDLQPTESSHAEECTPDRSPTVSQVYATFFTPISKQESTCESNKNNQQARRAPCRPPLPDILSNNISSKPNGPLKMKTNSTSSINFCETNNRFDSSQNPVSYPAALNPFGDESPCGSINNVKAIQKPYNPFDDEEPSMSDANTTYNIVKSSSSVALNSQSSQSSTCLDKSSPRTFKENSPSFPVEGSVSNESMDLRTAHSSICDLSSLLAYGCLSKPQSSSSLAGRSVKSSLPSSVGGVGSTVVKREVRGDRRSDFIPYSELHRKLYKINDELSKLEMSARNIQTKIKSMREEDGNIKELLNQWLHTVQLKDDLFKRESELLQRLRCQELEDRHAELEYELRTLLAKQDILKTKEEKVREEELIADLIYVVDKRAELAESVGNVKKKGRARSSTRKILENKFKQMCLSLKHSSLPHRESSAETRTLKKSGN
ncbi:unnamed protein product [Heterobilharzia americana]|nr:unnamed protein product [Heterobilharzia americana]